MALEDSAGVAGLRCHERKDPGATQRGRLSTVLSCTAVLSWRRLCEEKGDIPGIRRTGDEKELGWSESFLLVDQQLSCTWDSCRQKRLRILESFDRI